MDVAEVDIAGVGWGGVEWAGYCCVTVLGLEYINLTGT